MLIREAPMMDGSSPENGPSFLAGHNGRDTEQPLSVFFSFCLFSPTDRPFPHRSLSKGQELTGQPLHIADPSKWPFLESYL